MIDEPNSSMKHPTEGGLNSVKKSHGVSDTVEGQNTSTVIQEHSHSGGYAPEEFGADVVVIERTTVWATVQRPGVFIESKPTLS